VVTLRTASSPATTQGRSRTWPKARMAASPGIRMGVPASTPNTPTFVMVMVPPARSAGVVLPARAVAASCSNAWARPASGSACAPFTFGTSSPRSAATAMPRLTCRLTTISCAASSQEELIMGWRRAATSSAFATNSSGDTLTPANSGSSRAQRTAAIVSVTSTCRNSVTWGAVNALETIAAAVCLRTPRTGIRSSAAGAAGCCSLGSVASGRVRASSAARSTSSLVTEPSGPLPASCPRFTPRSLARRRTGGLALLATGGPSPPDTPLWGSPSPIAPSPGRARDGACGAGGWGGAGMPGGSLIPAGNPGNPGPPGVPGGGGADGVAG
jgi:hypothetical protein